MRISAPVALMMFALGLWLLADFCLNLYKIHRLKRQMHHAWSEVETLLQHRAEHLPALLALSDAVPALADARRLARVALAGRGDPAEDFLESEQQISRAITTFSACTEALRLSTNVQYAAFTASLREIMEQEAAIASAQEYYNAAASAVNTYRTLFPAGLIARALIPDAAPLFYPARDF